MIPDEPQQTTLNPDPSRVSQHLIQQVAQKSLEAAQNWDGMQQLNEMLTQTRVELSQAYQELAEARAEVARLRNESMIIEQDGNADLQLTLEG